MRVAIYARISLDKRGEEAGVDRQVEACEARVRSEGWTLVETLRDNSVSAYSGGTRPEFERLFALGVDAVVVWHLDRLARRYEDLRRVIDAGLSVYSVNGADLKAGDASGELLAGLMTMVSSFESAHKGERVAAAHASRARSGQLPRPTPYGYSGNGEPVEPQATAVRETVETFLRTRNLAEAVRTLQRTDPDASSSRNSVRLLLLRPCYAGLASYKGEVIEGVETTWTPIITVEQHRRVRSILSSPTRRVTRHERGHVHSLGSGLFVCGVCGLTMRGAGSDYRCESNAHLRRGRDDIDAVVMTLLFDRIIRADSEDRLLPRAAHDDSRVGELNAQHDDLVRRRDDISDLVADGLIERTKARADLERIRSELDAVAAELARLDTTPGAAPQPYNVAETLTVLPLNALRNVLAALMTVTIHSQTGGGPTKKGERRRPRVGTITVAWHDEPSVSLARASDALSDWTVPLTFPRPSWLEGHRLTLLEDAPALTESVRQALWKAVSPFATGRVPTQDETRRFLERIESGALSLDDVRAYNEGVGGRSA